MLALSGLASLALLSWLTAGSKSSASERTLAR